MERITEQPYVLENVITRDEMWIFQYNSETKRQSMNWKTPTSPRMKKKKKNEQVKSEGNDDHFLQHQRHNHD
jgi:hypothetical protein